MCRRKFNILINLNETNLIVPTFSLNRNNIMAAVFIESDIKFIDLNLPDTFDRSS